MDPKIIPAGPEELAAFLKSLPEIITAYEATLARKKAALVVGRSAYDAVEAEVAEEIQRLEYQLAAAKTLLANAQQVELGLSGPLIVH